MVVSEQLNPEILHFYYIVLRCITPEIIIITIKHIDLKICLNSYLGLKKNKLYKLN